MTAEKQEGLNPESPAGSIDAIRIRHALERLRSEQNLLSGIVGGAIGAIVGASAWAILTILTGFQIGWMAVGVGFLVGIGTRQLGKGVDQSFGIAGAILSLGGCALGNLLAVCGMLSRQESIPFFEILSNLDFSMIQELMVATFSPMDVLFYGIAVYEGYKFSIRRLTPEDLGVPAQGAPGARPDKPV